MNYKTIKNQRDKYFRMVRCLQSVEIKGNKTEKNIQLDKKVSEGVKEGKKRYNFYNNLLKAMSI